MRVLFIAHEKNGAELSKFETLRPCVVFEFYSLFAPHMETNVLPHYGTLLFIETVEGSVNDEASALSFYQALTCITVKPVSGAFQFFRPRLCLGKKFGRNLGRSHSIVPAAYISSKS